MTLPEPHRNILISEDVFESNLNLFFNLNLKLHLKATLNFDFDTSNKEFYIDKSKASAKKEAAQTMIGIAEEFNIIRQANDHWKPKKN